MQLTITETDSPLIKSIDWVEEELTLDFGDYMEVYYRVPIEFAVRLAWTNKKARFYIDHIENKFEKKELLWEARLSSRIL